jgi:long-chain acyl-CoA synthetase
MIYTSGTTGLPKGVKKNPVSPDNRRAYLDLRAQWFGHRHGMRTAIVGPMYHSVQSTYAIAAVQSNGVVYLMPKFDAEAVLELIHTARLTHLHLVPTMMIRLLQLPERVRRQYDVSSLEFVVHGAAPCPRETKRKMIDWWGKIIFEYYGTTEAGMVCRSSSEEWLEREGTVGKAWPGRTIRIYDEEGNPQPPNVPGEVYMSLGLVPDFTYHNAAGKREQIGRDGLITNGDIGYLDEDGYLFLCDRKYDTIISGGVNIYPFEIESVLLSHPAVFDCAVYGVPDANLGEVPAASVQLRIGVTASPEEFADFLNERLARFKVPRRIEMCEALPRDESGKIYKRLLKATASLSPNRSDYFPW